MIKNIIIVADYAYVEGGAAKVAIQTAIALSQIQDIDVYFFAGSGTPCQELENSRIKIKSMYMYDLLNNPNRFDASINGIYNVEAGKELKNLLLHLNIEETIVHIHTWTKVLSSSIFQVCKDIGVKTFLTIHDYFLVCPNGACYNYKKEHICLLKPLSFKCITCNCDARCYLHKIWRCIRQLKQNKVLSDFTNINYITISKFQQKQILKRTNLIQKTSLVENLIDVPTSFKVNSSMNDIFLFIGRVCKEKGIELFCNAVYKSKVKGVVIGDGPLIEEIKKRFPDITFLGWLNKESIDSWIKKTRALLFVSAIYECSPLTIPEVLAHGIPCIVTKGNAGTDNIINEINGVIVSRDVDSVSTAINKFKSDSYVSSLSNNAYNLFNFDLCSEKIYINKLLKVYQGYDN